MARAGVLPGDTQASHTAFISAKLAMSVIQMLADSSLRLVGADLGQEAVDLPENVLRLLR